MAEVISLSPDAIPDEIEAAPPPPNVGSVTIETDAQGNRVNFAGYTDVDGVPEGGGPEDPNPVTESVFPVPAKNGQESE